MSLDSQPVSSFQSISAAPLTPLTKDVISKSKVGTGKLTYIDTESQQPRTKQVTFLLTKQDLAQFGGFFTSNATCLQRFAEALSAPWENLDNQVYVRSAVTQKGILLSNYTFLDAEGKKVIMSDHAALSRIATITSCALPAIHTQQLNADSALALIDSLNNTGNGTDHKLVMQKDGFLQIQTRTSTKDIHKSTNTVKAFKELFTVAKNEKDLIKKLQLLKALDESTWAKNVCKGNVSCRNSLKEELVNANQVFFFKYVKPFNDSFEKAKKEDDPIRKLNMLRKLKNSPLVDKVCGGVNFCDCNIRNELITIIPSFNNEYGQLLIKLR